MTATIQPTAVLEEGVQMRNVCLLASAVFFFVAPAAWPQGDPLGPEFRVNTYATSDQAFPAVSRDAGGNFVVVWTSGGQDGSAFGVFGQRFAGSGLPLGAEFRVNTYTTGNQGFFQQSVAGDAAGNFVVAWTDYEQAASSINVFGQRFATSGAPLGSEFRVNTFIPGYKRYPSVAADASGNFVIVWESSMQDGSAMGVIGQRYSSSGALLGTEFRVNTYTTGTQRRPSVGADSVGNFVVVWESDAQDGSAQGVFGQRYASSGVPLGPEFRVNAYTPDAQLGPSVAVSASGGFVVVWSGQNQNEANFGVFGQRFAGSGTPLGPEFRANSFTTGTQAQAKVAIDSAENFVVVWFSDAQVASRDVFGQRYSDSGTPLGTEFRINTYSTSHQFLPAVASDPAGNFVVVWTSLAQDGAGYGVFAQRYSPILPVVLMRFDVE